MHIQEGPYDSSVLRLYMLSLGEAHINDYERLRYINEHCIILHTLQVGYN